MVDWHKAVAHWTAESATQGVLVTDKELTIRNWNRWLEAHSGHRVQDLLGRNLLRVYPDLVQRGLDRSYQAVLAGQVQMLSQLFHRYLLPMPATQDINGSTIMPQSAPSRP